MLAGCTFLVTGATGRLGADLTHRLEDLGASVIPAVLPGYPCRPRRTVWRARTAPLEIHSEKDLDRLPTPDYVIHLHWRVDRGRPYPEQIVNELSWNVVELSFLWDWLRRRPVKRFVNCSSIRVFSHLNENPISAETEPSPTSPYGLAKLSGEKFFRAYFNGIPVTHLRLCSVCSVGENPSQLMSQLAASVFKGTQITLNVGHSVHMLYIEEAVDLVVSAALKARRDRYLVVGETTSVAAIAREFEQISGRALHAEYVNLNPDVVDPVFQPNFEELRTEWVRVVPLREAISRIAAAWSDSA